MKLRNICYMTHPIVELIELIVYALRSLATLFTQRCFKAVFTGNNSGERMKF